MREILEQVFEGFEWDVDESPCPAIYASLILNARAIGRHDVADLFERNLRSEENALEKVIAEQEQGVAVSPMPHPATR